MAQQPPILWAACFLYMCAIKRLHKRYLLTNTFPPFLSIYFVGRTEAPCYMALHGCEGQPEFYRVAKLPLSSMLFENPGRNAQGPLH